MLIDLSNRTLTLDELRISCCTDAKYLLSTSHQPNQLATAAILLSKAARLVQLETEEFIKASTGQPYQPNQVAHTLTISNNPPNPTLAAAVNALNSTDYPMRLVTARALLLAANDVYTQALDNYTQLVNP